MKCSNFHLILVIFFLILSIIKVHGQETPWEDIGPCMGNINTMVMDDLHPDTLYAGTLYGVFKSVNGATNWIRTSFPSLEVIALEISKSHANYLIAATNYSVYLSDNYGDSWTVIWSDSMEVSSIALNPENPNSIYIGTNEYILKSGDHIYTEWIYKSLNGGSTWEKVYFNNGEIEQINKIVIDPSDTTKMYVGIKAECGSKGYVLVSHDNGSTWKMNDLSGKFWRFSGQEYRRSSSQRGMDCLS